MTEDQFITEVVIFCEQETPKIIADLQRIRFANQGAFNGNERWYDNNPLVIKDKGRNKPLVDSGNLKRELENVGNWDLKPHFAKDTLTLTIPETENFTDSKYNILQTGGKTKPYTSKRGNFVNIHNIGARQFKNLSAEDVEWIQQKLVEAIKVKFT